MYNKIISIPLLIIGLILLIFITGPKIIMESGAPGLLSVAQIIGIFFSSVGFVWIFASVINSMNEAQEQLRLFTKIREYKAKIPILVEYKNSVLNEFKDLLTKEYPAYEKELVSKFSFDAKNAESALIALAPALKTSKMYIDYAEKINIAMKNILTNELIIQDIIQHIQEYNTNPWYWFKISMPADIAKLAENQIPQ